jgi:GTP-binding protein HflX
MRARVFGTEQAILVGILYGNDEEEESLRELEALADTAGIPTLAVMIQKRSRPHPATFIGRGKVEELKAAVGELKADVVIFNEELRPAQARNLETALNRKVIDRTQLIMDIFAQRAATKEAKLQVELAQLHYLLPRLRGWGISLTRAGGRSVGGVGTRGPGETQLELDRNKIYLRIHSLERRLKKAAGERVVRRSRRSQSELPEVALVGYTNSGKSTLLNHLTGAGVLTQDQLFSTLDPTIRRLDLGNGRTVLLSDTVGFVRRLPHGLIEAFRSTLEEVTQSDLLLHVVDAGEPALDAQIAAVRSVLEEINGAHLPELLVVNKVDTVDQTARTRLSRLYPEAIAVSALEGDGIEQLLVAIDETLRSQLTEVVLIVPYDRGDVLAAVHREGEVIKEEHLSEGTRIQARLPHPRLAGFEAFTTTELASTPDAYRAKSTQERES